MSLSKKKKRKKYNIIKYKFFITIPEKYIFISFKISLKKKRAISDSLPFHP